LKLLLFPSDRAARWLVLPAAVLMQVCLGATYSWAAYVGALREVTGLGQAAVQAPYAVFYYIFPLTMAVLASVPFRLPRRAKAVVGGLLFGGAWVAAGFTASDFRLTTLCIGVLGGVGAGLAYLVPVATAVAWFPRHKGLVTGIAVAGFGGGAALLGTVADHLLARPGWTPYAVLRTLGVAFAVVVPLAGLVMRQPFSGGTVVVAPRVPAREVLGGRAFWILFLTFSVGLAAGLAVNGNLRQLGASAADAVSLVPLFAIGNAAGRILWGVLADRAGPAASIAANLASWAVVLLTGPVLTASLAGLQVFAAVAGFIYGGVLVVHPAAVVRRWGSGAFTRVYGWLAAGHLLAAFSPPLAGVAFDRTGSFALPFVVLALLAAIASSVAWYGRREVAEKG
jgi:OFA family oxalate/formate antiporter-like MFS transporter